MKPGKPVAFGRVDNPAGGGRRLHRPARQPGVELRHLPDAGAALHPAPDGRRGRLPRHHPAAFRLAAARPPPRVPARADRRGRPGRSCFPNQGPGVLSSTVWAAGLVDNPAGHAVARGEPVPSFPIPNCCHEHQGSVFRQPARNPRLLPRNPDPCRPASPPSATCAPPGPRAAAWEALGEGRNVSAAINQEMAGPDRPVADRDEIAFFPRHRRLTCASASGGRLRRRRRNRGPSPAGRRGGRGHLVGLRPRRQAGWRCREQAVSAMTLEHYPGMTEKSLEAIVAEAEGRWSLLGCG